VANLGTSYSAEAVREAAELCAGVCDFFRPGHDPGLLASPGLCRRDALGKAKDDLEKILRFSRSTSSRTYGQKTAVRTREPPSLGLRLAWFYEPTTHEFLKEGFSMLVLTRKTGQEIIIGDTVRITITQIKGDRVRIGIDAPPNLMVDRQEVHERRREFAERFGLTISQGPSSAPSPACV
jgi:carbon storage regulator